MLSLHKDWQWNCPNHFAGQSLIQVHNLPKTYHQSAVAIWVFSPQAKAFVSCIELITMYKAFIWSSMDDCSPLWAGTHTSHTAYFERVKSKALLHMGMSRQEMDSQGLSLFYGSKLVGALFYTTFHMASLFLPSCPSRHPMSHILRETLICSHSHKVQTGCLPVYICPLILNVMELSPCQLSHLPGFIFSIVHIITMSCTHPSKSMIFSAHADYFPFHCSPDHCYSCFVVVVVLFVYVHWNKFFIC